MYEILFIHSNKAWLALHNLGYPADMFMDGCTDEEGTRHACFRVPEKDVSDVLEFLLTEYNVIATAKRRI